MTTPASRPAPVDLDDLADPRFGPEARALLDTMEEAGAGITLDPAALMAEARIQTGLDDFGDEEFVPRLEALCGAFDTAGLDGAGRLTQAVLLTGLLVNRLRLEDLIGRHPEILEVEVTAPIVICGLPRTGTTHLHNLLAADPALRSLPYWESLEPVPDPAERAAGTDVAARRERCAAALGFVDLTMPEFKRMHEMTVDHAHEEIQLLAVDFSTMLFETTAPLPGWRDAYLGRDQHPSYAYLRRMLQALQWLRGGHRWVLKSPQHLEQLPVLADTFPDATFVVTHRDPVTVVVSMITMLAYSARLVTRPVDVDRIARYWSDRLVRMLRACVDDRDRLPADQAFDLHFDRFMADEDGTLGAIYARAGQPLTAAGREAMAAFLGSHPRGRHGTVRYDPAALGLDVATLRADTAFYTERFGIAVER